MFFTDIEDRIPLKRISGPTYHFGYMVTTYKCPCKKGEVIYEKDDTIGCRESSIHTTCAYCDAKYEFMRDFAIEK